MDPQFSRDLSTLREEAIDSVNYFLSRNKPELHSQVIHLLLCVYEI